MKRLALGLVALLALGGGGYGFLQKFRIEGLEQIRVVERDGALETSTALPEDDTAVLLPSTKSGVPVARRGDTIRIASFNIQVLGSTKLSKPLVMERLAQIARKFDIIAVQEIRSLDQTVLPQFVDLINSGGRAYDFVIGPRLGRTVSKEQYAYIFDRASIEVDRSQTYTMHDPADLMHREPFVALFRVRGPSPQEAFTFRLVNVHTDPEEVSREAALTAQILQKVRDDGVGEDDVIVLGDFNANDRQLRELSDLDGMTLTVQGVATTPRGTKQYDNIVFDPAATVEFTGRAGVFDFLRAYNLSVEEAIEISDHLPVWAEFSIYEGASRVAHAPRPADAR